MGLRSRVLAELNKWTWVRVVCPWACGWSSSRAVWTPTHGTVMRTAFSHCGLVGYGRRRGRGRGRGRGRVWAWGRIGWLTGCRGSRACRRRPTNSCHAACVSRPLATHQARRTVVVAMQASRPAGQSGLSNDTMRWTECTGPAHPRLAASVPGQPGPLTVSLPAHRFPVFGRGLLQEDAIVPYMLIC